MPRGGSIEGSRLAIIDLPAPGGPTIRILWPPAQATSKARFTVSCPLTSEKSKSNFSASAAKISRVLMRVGSCTPLPSIISMASPSVRTPYTSTRLTTAASVTLASGTMSRLKPISRALTAIGSAPRTGSTDPSRLSSPVIM